MLLGVVLACTAGRALFATVNWCWVVQLRWPLALVISVLIFSISSLAASLGTSDKKPDGGGQPPGGPGASGGGGKPNQPRAAAPQYYQGDSGTVYNAFISYHNSLVGTRFVIAGLFMAANGFLVSGYFARREVVTGSGQDMSWALPALGIAIAAVCFLLEFRTRHILDNMGKVGGEIEEEFSLPRGRPFFDVMGRQDLGPRVPFVGVRVPPNFVPSALNSHTFGLNLLYVIVSGFWAMMLSRVWAA